MADAPARHAQGSARSELPRAHYDYFAGAGGEAGVAEVLEAFGEDLRLALALAGPTLADTIDENRVRLAGC